MEQPTEFFAIMTPEEFALMLGPRILLSELSKEVLREAGCGNKTTISSALNLLPKYIQKLINRRQVLWKSGGVGVLKKRGNIEEGGCENEAEWQHIFDKRIHADDVIWVLESLPDHTRNLNRVIEEIA